MTRVNTSDVAPGAFLPRVRYRQGGPDAPSRAARPGAVQGVPVIRPRGLPLLILTLFFVLAAVAPVAARSVMALGVSTPGPRHASTVEPAVNEFTASVGGHKPATWSLWSQWGSRGNRKGCVAGQGTCSFPSSGVGKLHEMGISPVVWWEPVNPERPESPKFSSWERVLAGKHDNYIKEWAQDARTAGLESGRKIILRFAHEANGFWFPWGMGRFTNTPKNFKNAWRRVWRIFRDEGALPYVDFLWSVSKQRCPQCNPFAQVYPGDKFVDYAGVTAFNWGRWHGRSWQSMMAVLADPIRDIQRVTPRPIFIAETASHWKGGRKDRWLRAGYQQIYDRFPRVKAILYLNSDEPHQEAGHPDWRLVKPGDGSALDAYGDLAAKPRFKGTLQ
jgi:Glycosyl hydrolase family 26